MSQVASNPLLPSADSAARPRLWFGGRSLARHIAARPRLASCVAIFSVCLVVRLINWQQPLVENFIDRQVHTAMMARNIARGGSMLYPKVDIGPFPAYYMLEFPAFPALAAATAAVTGLPLDMAGRLVSALAMAAACVLLFDLVRRHDGIVVGLAAGLVLVAMPVTIRYGRGFQPDALMFALLVAGVWSMDRWCDRGRARDLAIAAAATSGALLLKVISAYVLVPLVYLAWKRLGRLAWRRWELWAALALVALPSVAWYVHAWHVASSVTTVSTTFWQADKWIALGRLVQIDTYRQLAYFVGWRVLTPVGVVLAIVGSLLRPPQTTVLTHHSRTHHSPTLLFHVWLASLATYFPILVRKLDHEHYYLAFAPVAAVFIARAFVALASAPLVGRCYVTGPQAASVLAVALLATNAVACRSTFRDPKEWAHVQEAAAAVQELAPPDSLVAGHSSVLFYADRRGFAFEGRPNDVAYHFGTWGETRAAPTAIDLLEFYRDQGATHFVELLGANREHEHPELFEYVRTHFRVLRDEPGKFLVVALND